jgi:hypothetical protein
MNKEIAAKILETTAKCSNDLSALVPYLKGHCDDQTEYEIYAKKIAKIMAAIFFEINSSLHEKYPELKPDHLD